MNNEEYFKVSEMERDGKLDEAFLLLQELAMKGDAMAMLDLSARYYSVEGYANPVKQISPDHEKSRELAVQAKKRLEELSEEGDGEAMRMLASTYFGHWSPALEKSIEKAEKLLLDAIEAGCFFAANELATFYVGSDLDKANYYYQLAEKHNCRVIQDDRLKL